jgi:hypothetical protein
MEKGIPISIAVLLLALSMIGKSYSIESLDDFLSSNDIKLEINPPLEDIGIKIIDPVFDGDGFLGHIQNTRDKPIIIDEVIITFYDSQGKVVGLHKPYPDIAMFTNRLNTNQSSPFDFDMRFDIPSEQIQKSSKVKIDFDISETYSNNKEQKLALKSGDNYKDSNIFLTSLGEISNTGDAKASLHSIRAAIYDKNNQIVAMGMAWTQPRELEPNESGAFEITTAIPSDTNIAYVSFFVDSDKYSIIEPNHNITIDSQDD